MTASTYTPTSSDIVSSVEITSKPINDNRSLRAVTLPNGLEALLIHDPDADKAAGALDVNIGYYEDPEDLPGLAHFCEHLLFMGTEKYPSENEYSQYMAQHNGDSNAYTSSEHTNYQFQVGYKHLEGAVDRFAQFFISPLFLPSCKDREVRAVDSENKNNLQNDVWRLQHLMGFLSNKEHPNSKFSTGNVETLETVPNSKGLDVRERLIEFYNKHYSANIMKLVLLGREDLDTLQEWAVKYFSAIENKNVTRPSYSVPRLTEKHLGECIYVKPVKDLHRLTLDFPVPDQADLFESRPGYYLGSILGHEGEGTILQHLKSLGWASGLMAGTYDVSIGQNKFLVIIDLTPEGVKHYKEVIEICFQYIDIMKSSPVQDHIYHESKTMSEVNFKYRQKGGARTTVSNLAQRLHEPYPRERILDYSVLTKYDPKEIRRHIEALTPRNFRANLVAQHLDVELDQTEYHYGTQYHVERFSDEFLKKLENLPSNPNLSLPTPNEFIPDDFSVEKKTVETPLAHPYLIRDSKQLRVWYKKDDTFWIPKADVRIYFHAPISHSSPTTSVMTSLFFSIFEDALSVFAYDAEIAGLGYSVSATKHGFTIRAKGYNSKIGVLLDHILKKLVDYEPDSLKFDVWKERLVRSYKNTDHTNTYYQADYHKSYLLEEGVYTLDECLEALENTTLESLNAYAKAILKRLDVEVLAFGNIHKKEALQIAENVLTVLKPQPLLESQTVTLRSVFMPPGSEYQFYHLNKNENNVNSCVKVIYQVCKLTEVKPRVILDLFNEIAHEPAFNVLRTREQLGYIVFSGTNRQRTVISYRIIVQSERSPALLQQRIDKFLVELGEKLESFTEEEIQEYIKSVVDKKLEKAQNMGEEASRYHEHIVSGYYNFLAHLDDIPILKSLTKKDVIDFFNTYISPSSPTRSVLTINIHAAKPVNFTPDQVAASVFSSLAIKYQIDFDSAETAELVGEAQGKSPNEILAIAQKALEKKGRGDIAPQFVAEAAKEIQEQIAVETQERKPGTTIESAPWFKARMSLTEAPVPFKDLKTWAENEAKL